MDEEYLVDLSLSVPLGQQVWDNSLSEGLPDEPIGGPFFTKWEYE